VSSETIVLNRDELIGSGNIELNEIEFPLLIQGQVDKLNELDKKVTEAIKAADKAKDSANAAKEKSAGFGKKKAAIEELQSAGIGLADAVQSGAEAQKISFEFHRKLADITKYLFRLGVSNIASNRFVIRELELKLQGASKEELSELARQELISVIKQLREQEDILKKQEHFSKMIKIHDERLKSQIQRSELIDEQLINQSEVINKQTEELLVLLEKNNQLNGQLKQYSIEIESLSSQVSELKDNITTLKILLDTKSSRIGLKATLALSFVALAISLSRFIF
jgi:hypothetical protein